MFLPTFEQCKEIVKSNEAFQYKQLKVHGFETYIFNYRLASFSDFDKPIEDKDYQAYELRGLTFVKYGSSFRRYLMLYKFFNLNQTDITSYDRLRNIPIIREQEKLDGTMIRFIKLPNGKIFAKTKFDVGNYQCEQSERLLNENINLLNFVEYTLKDNLAAIFEFTSPFNRVVLKYKNTELKLVQLRDEKTGEYFDIYSSFIRYFGIPVVDGRNLNNSYTLYEYKSRIDTDKDKEGWVLTLANKQLVKIKTNWYLENHRLFTESINREDFIISATLNENIDDVISALEEGSEERVFVEDIASKVSKYYNVKCKEISEIVSKYDRNKKNFAISNKEYEYFHVLMQVASSLDRDSQVNTDEIVKKFLKERIIKICYHLDDARRFVEKISNS